MARVKDNYPDKIGVGESNAKRGYPSHFADPEVKKKPEWCMAYVRGMHWEYRGGTGPGLFRNVSNKYQEWRDYARGKQDIEQYKEMMGPKKKRNRGKQDTTWKNLDWSILPIAPKFVQILQGMIMAQPKIIKIRAIDSASLEAERMYENELSEWITNRDWLSKLKDTLPEMDMQSPVRDEDPEPSNLGEVPLYKDLFYKDEAAMEMKDVIDVSNEVNNMPQIHFDYVEDLIEVGVGGTRTFIDSNGFFKARRVVPERLTVNKCKFKDFSDLFQVGEYLDITISELKQWAGGQFTEEDYKKIAEKAGQNKISGQGLSDSYQDVNVNPYDNTTITVMDAEWFSNDERIKKVSKDRFGNMRSEKVKRDFLPKDVSDDMYKEQYKGERYITRRIVKNKYRAIWIVDTDYIFNFGLATDMETQPGSIGSAELSYQLYTLNFDSIIRRIIPALDQIQINWLQFQNHIARSRPAGLSIEMSALENLSLGKGGQRMTPKEALRLYFDTGVLVWRMKQWSGGAGAQWRPIDELNNGLNDAAAQHFQNIINIIDVMRNILGLNQVQDASTPNPEIGKFVTETASTATAHALSYLYTADTEIYERTAKATMLLLPNLIKRGKSRGMIEALGTKTYNFFKTNNDLTYHEFSLKIEVGPNEEQQAAINRYIELALGKEQISPEQAIMLGDEKNPYKQVALLRHYKQEKAKEAIEEQQAVAEIEAQKNAASSQAAAESDITREEAINGFKMQLASHEAQLEMQKNQAAIQGELILAKINNGSELTETEKKLEASIMEVRMKIVSAEKIASQQQKAQVSAARAMPRPTASAKK